MFKNYLKVALRSFGREKLVTFINVAGLAVGMASFIIILQYVRFEMSYDRHLPQVERMHRVIAERSNGGMQVDRRAVTFGAMGAELKTAFPQVEAYTRIWTGHGPVVLAFDNQPFTEQFAVADENFLSFFGFRMIHGDARTALGEPNTAVLSASAARKYFKDANPVGKVFRVNSQYDSEMSSPFLRITGVYADIPQNTHLRTDFIGSFKSINNTARWGPNYMSEYPVFTYLRLTPGARADALEQKLVEKYQKTDRKEFRFLLQPVTKIHLYSDLSGEVNTNGNEKTIYFLILIAAFILVIAWINYVNLSNAVALRRSREVGVRKAVGGAQYQLMFQFLFESLLLNAIAAVLAVVLSQMALPFFNQLIGKPLTLHWWNDPAFGGLLLLSFAVGAVLAGLYPAFVLSVLKPANLLRNQVTGTDSFSARQQARLKKGLVVFQFAISLTLIVFTFAVYRQLSYMRSQDLGMNIDQVLVLPSPTIGIGNDSVFAGKIKTFKARLLQYPSIGGITSSLNIPGQPVRTNTGIFRRVESSPNEQNNIGFFFTDEDFLPTYGLKLVAGRNFSTLSFEGDPNNRGAILNEAAVRALGFRSAREAIDQGIFAVPGPRKTPVIGVVANYNQQSLKERIEPIVIQYSPASSFGMTFSFKLKADQPGKSIALIEEQWEQMFPGNPFDYFFLNEFFNQQYQADLLLGKIFGLFSVLAIAVACFGLFGLALLSAGQRTKEIGIRKAFGASSNDIFYLLSREFLGLVLLSVLMSVPIAYLAVSRWLENFAFRIPVSAWLFVAPSLLVLLIALLTIGYQAVRKSKIKPVQSLRYE